MKIEGKPDKEGSMTRVTVLMLIYPKAPAFSLVTGDKARLFLCFNSVLFMADALIAEGWGGGERRGGGEGGGGGGEGTKERRDYADRQKDEHTRSLLLHINNEFTMKI